MDNLSKDNSSKYHRVCKECREPFKTNRKDKRYCCDKCRNKHWIKENPRLKLAE